jgi:hypothetical protein
MQSPLLFVFAPEAQTTSASFVACDAPTGLPAGPGPPTCATVVALLVNVNVSALAAVALNANAADTNSNTLIFVSPLRPASSAGVRHR